MYNGVIRALQQFGLADLYGNTAVPLYVMNVTYPLIDDEVRDFCRGKDAVLVVEEGQPDYIEQALAKILRNAGVDTKTRRQRAAADGRRIYRQGALDGVVAFLRATCAELFPDLLARRTSRPPTSTRTLKELQKQVPMRPPGFCTGCPERPIFAAMKLVQKELGQHQVASDIGCHLFSIMPPFNIGGTTMGYGLGAGVQLGLRGTGREAFDRGDGRRRLLA